MQRAGLSTAFPAPRPTGGGTSPSVGPGEGGVRARSAQAFPGPWLARAAGSDFPEVSRGEACGAGLSGALRAGEEHYNCISALHKSMRGSDSSAALYWLGRMLEGGEDPLYVARRLVRFASEDVGECPGRGRGSVLGGALGVSWAGGEWTRWRPTCVSGRLAVTVMGHCVPR